MSNIGAGSGRRASVLVPSAKNSLEKYPSIENVVLFGYIVNKLMKERGEELTANKIEKNLTYLYLSLFDKDLDLTVTGSHLFEGSIRGIISDINTTMNITPYNAIQQVVADGAPNDLATRIFIGLNMGYIIGEFEQDRLTPDDIGRIISDTATEVIKADISDPNAARDTIQEDIASYIDALLDIKNIPQYKHTFDPALVADPHPNNTAAWMAMNRFKITSRPLAYKAADYKRHAAYYRRLAAAPAAPGANEISDEQLAALYNEEAALGAGAGPAVPMQLVVDPQANAARARAALGNRMNIVAPVAPRGRVFRGLVPAAPAAPAPAAGPRMAWYHGDDLCANDFTTLARHASSDIVEGRDPRIRIRRCIESRQQNINQRNPQGNNLDKHNAAIRKLRRLVALLDGGYIGKRVVFIEDYPGVVGGQFVVGVVAGGKRSGKATRKSSKKTKKRTRKH
jgi:hypothetical protein